MENYIQDLLKSLLEHPVIDINDIPNIDLYMDQVTTFMDTALGHGKRYPEDKIMTKTMVNNYTKNHLLPPPVKKKYSKEHILLLVMIYYFKSIFSISDIQSLLQPLSDDYFPKNNQNGLQLEQIFDTLMSQIQSSKPETEQTILSILNKNLHLFSEYDMSEDEANNLNLFALITQLSYDIYIRKQLIEKLIDQKNAQDKKEKKNKK